MHYHQLFGDVVDSCVFPYTSQTYFFSSVRCFFAWKFVVCNLVIRSRHHRHRGSRLCYHCKKYKSTIAAAGFENDGHDDNDHDFLLSGKTTTFFCTYFLHGYCSNCWRRNYSETGISSKRMKKSLFSMTAFHFYLLLCCWLWLEQGLDYKVCTTIATAITLEIRRSVQTRVSCYLVAWLFCKYLYFSTFTVKSGSIKTATDKNVGWINAIKIIWSWSD